MRFDGEPQEAAMRRLSFLHQPRLIVLLWIWLAGLMFGQSGSAQTVVPPDREELLKGLAMGLASCAEENGYPGPQHVLDMKDDLELTHDQLMKTEALRKVIGSSAVVKGGEIVQAEEELNKLFASARMNEHELRQKIEEIGKLRADLRFIHLQAYVRMKQILTAEQLRRYSERRGHESRHQD
jgi:Spy/CpxP family protein refolding chaperone